MGRSFGPGNLSGLGDAVAEMIEHPDAWSARIAEVRSGTIYNIGHSAEIAGEYLLQAMLDKQTAHDREGGLIEDKAQGDPVGNIACGRE